MFLHPQDLASPGPARPVPEPGGTPLQDLARRLAPAAPPASLPSTDATSCLLRAGTLDVMLSIADDGQAVILAATLGAWPGDAWAGRLLAGNLAAGGGVEATLALDEADRVVLALCLPLHHLRDAEMLDCFQRFVQRGLSWQHALRDAATEGPA